MEKFKSWWERSTKNKVIFVGAVVLVGLAGLGVSVNKPKEASTSPSNDEMVEVASEETKPETDQENVEEKLSRFSPKDIYDDKTCHWYLSVVTGDIQMQEIARDYVARFIEKSVDIHYVV